MAVSVKQVKDELLKLFHPEINNNLIELGMIKEIKIESGIALIKLALPFLNVSIKQDLINLIKKSLKGLGLKVIIETVEMSGQEKENFKEMARKGWRL